MRNYFFLLLFGIFSIQSNYAQGILKCSHSLTDEQINETLRILDASRDDESRKSACQDNLSWDGGDQTYRLIIEFSSVYHTMDDIETSLYQN